jgi:Polysaccharide lyase
VPGHRRIYWIAALVVAVAGVLATYGSGYSSPSTGAFVADFEIAAPGWQQFDALLYEEDRPLADSFALVDHPVRRGNSAVRVTARQGYSRFGEEESTSLSWHGGEKEGDDYWYAWSTLFPTSWVAPYSFGIFAEWHASLATSPIVGFGARGNFAELTLLSGQTDEAANTAAVDRVVPLLSTLSKGRWNDFVMHVRWTSRARGFVEVFHRVQGERSFRKVVDLQNVPTLQATSDGRGRDFYLLMGIYRRSYCAQPTELDCNGPGGRVQPPSVVYHDSFVRADSFASAVADAFGDPPSVTTSTADSPALQTLGTRLPQLRLHVTRARGSIADRQCSVRSNATGGFVARIAGARDDRDTAVAEYRVPQRSVVVVRQRVRIAGVRLGGRLVISQLRTARGRLLAELSVGRGQTLHLSSPPGGLSAGGFYVDTGIAYGPGAAPRTVELRLTPSSISAGVDGRLIVRREVDGPRPGSVLRARLGIERYDAGSAPGRINARYEKAEVGTS